MSSMQPVLSTTTTAPDPSIDCSAFILSQSSGVSSNDAGRYPDDGPEGAKPTISRPSSAPPPKSSISSRYVIPIGTSNTPGRRTFPVIPTNFTPGDPCRPKLRYHSPPLPRIVIAWVNVSTLFSAVGFPHRPELIVRGGLLRGSARLPWMASISAVSSPQI